MDNKGLAVIGSGKVGRACAELVLSSREFTLGGIVRRPESLGTPLPEGLRNCPVTAHLHELTGVQGAMLCVPAEAVEDVAQQVLQAHIPIIDCTILHGDAFQSHKEVLHRMACRYKVPGILGAGWDPGALSLVRLLFAVLTPTGHTTILHRSAKNLHHTMTVESVSGVKAALCTEIRSGTGRWQRYVYVELDKGADQERVIATIKTDPVFLEEETLVFSVDSIAAMEEQGHGIVLERRGTSGRTGHQHLLLEARFDVIALTAQMMLAAARALPWLRPGVYSLMELPLAHLFADSAERVERDWC